MRTPIALSAFLAVLSSALAGNWPAWRGPNADGTTPETELPLHFSAAKGVKWKIALPERGNSTPIVWDTKIFLTQAVGTKRTVMCVDRKDGRTLWRERMQTPVRRANTLSSLVKSGGRIFAVTQNSDVVVFKASPDKFEQLAVNSMADGLTNSSLAVSDSQLFLRTHKHLWCIGK